MTAIPRFLRERRLSFSNGGKSPHTWTLKVLADPPHLGRPECLQPLPPPRPTRPFTARKLSLDLTPPCTIPPPRSSGPLLHREHPSHETCNVPFVRHEVYGTDFRDDRSASDLTRDTAFVPGSGGGLVFPVR